MSGITVVNHRSKYRKGFEELQSVGVFLQKLQKGEGRA
jgi:hypothetical protein